VVHDATLATFDIAEQPVQPLGAEQTTPETVKAPFWLRHRAAGVPDDVHVLASDTDPSWDTVLCVPGATSSPLPRVARLIVQSPEFPSSATVSVTVSDVVATAVTVNVPVVAQRVPLLCPTTTVSPATYPAAAKLAVAVKVLEDELAETIVVALARICVWSCTLSAPSSSFATAMPIAAYCTLVWAAHELTVVPTTVKDPKLVVQMGAAASRCTVQSPDVLSEDTASCTTRLYGADPDTDTTVYSPAALHEDDAAARDMTQCPDVASSPASVPLTVIVHGELLLIAVTMNVPGASQFEPASWPTTTVLPTAYPAARKEAVASKVFEEAVALAMVIFQLGMAVTCPTVTVLPAL
jgi:hypothetical protein